MQTVTAPAVKQMNKVASGWIRIVSPGRGGPYQIYEFTIRDVDIDASDHGHRTEEPLDVTISTPAIRSSRL